MGLSQQAFSEGPDSSAKRNRLQEGWEDGHGEAGSAAQGSNGREAMRWVSDNSSQSLTMGAYYVPGKL